MSPLAQSSRSLFVRVDLTPRPKSRGGCVGEAEFEARSIVAAGVGGISLLVATFFDTAPNGRTA